MKIRQLAVQNYKSLRDISISLTDFTVVIGANGSGKSNLASAFDFLSDVYQFGLEYAVAKKGGYENIAYRKIRRTKSAISFKIDIELTPSETREISRSAILRDLTRTLSKGSSILIEHHFLIRTGKQSIRSDYSVVFESIHFKEAYDPRSVNLFDAETPTDRSLLRLIRSADSVEIESVDDSQRKRVYDFISYFKEFGLQDSSYDLIIRRLFSSISSILGTIAVHQFSPKISRAPGSPSPHPRLSGYGENLPSLVDWLKRHHPKRWRAIETAMRDILPELEEITIEYLHTKQLGLFFKEREFGRAWTAEDVSDGTIQTLSILSAIADPRNSVIFLEEPENSVHPWIVKQIARRLQSLSSETQIITTTHSPLVLNVVSPFSVLICHKEDAESKLTPLPEIAPEVVADWENGVDRLFELIDTGSVPQAVPITSN